MPGYQLCSLPRGSMEPCTNNKWFCLGTLAGMIRKRESISGIRFSQPSCSQRGPEMNPGWVYNLSAPLTNSLSGSGLPRKLLHRWGAGGGGAKDVVSGIEGLARETVPYAFPLQRPKQLHNCQGRAPLLARLVRMLLHAQGASPGADVDPSWQTQVVRKPWALDSGTFVPVHNWTKMCAQSSTYWWQKLPEGGGSQPSLRIVSRGCCRVSALVYLQPPSTFTPCRSFCPASGLNGWDERTSSHGGREG